MSHVPILPGPKGVGPLARVRRIWRDRTTRRWILAGAILGALIGALLIWFAMGRVPCCSAMLWPLGWR